jgi:hypothetical protein
MNIDNLTPLLFTYILTYSPTHLSTHLLTYSPNHPHTYLFIIDITILNEEVHYKRLHHMIKCKKKNTQTNTV